MAKKMGFANECLKEATELIINLYNLFIKVDGSLLEINPMAENVDGQGLFYFFGLGRGKQ